MKNRKKLIIVLILTALLVAALCASAFAAEVVDSGMCGKDVYWELDSDGVLTISGTGEMWNWTASYSDTAPWYKNRSIIKSVTISDRVSTIGDFAFEDCTSLTSVTIPDGVTTIGKWAFDGCKSLMDVYYDGSETDWDTIQIGDNNDPLLNAAIHFNSIGFTLGDVNGDGEMNNSDLVTVARYIVGLCDENTARIVEYMADMDGDEVVNNTDLVTVARIIVGL